MPWRVVRTILDRHTMIPSPLIYLAAFVAGALVGVALDALLGRPWWLVALVTLLLVFLAFLASAFIGLTRGPSLRDELLDAIQPGTRLKRMQQRHDHMIRTCPFPLFGLDYSWPGLRCVGGTSDDGRNLFSVQLTFGDHFGMDAWLRVGTATLGEGLAFDRRYWAIELWRRAKRPPPEIPSHEHSAWIDRRIDGRLAQGEDWSEVTISVDGADVKFDWLRDAADWVALATIGDVAVTVEGHRFPAESVRLVTVEDIEPFIEGTRRFFQERGEPDEE